MTTAPNSRSPFQLQFACREVRISPRTWKNFRIMIHVPNNFCILFRICFLCEKDSIFLEFGRGGGKGGIIEKIHTSHESQNLVL